MKKDYTRFAEKINVSFKNMKLLENAFIHRSFINENQGAGKNLEHNERLEFLGDAVLELVVTEYLFNKYKNKQEGELTAYRAALVNAVTLAEVATDMGVNDFLLLSKGEAKDTGRARQNILADAFESILGAIYIEHGYNECKKFIEKYLLVRTEEVVNKGRLKDAKSKVQEMSQEVYGVTPKYRVVKETGPDHDKHFTVAIFFGAEKVAEGEGKSKQEAEQQAAVNANQIKGWS
jgi:ribonuclease-3